MYPIFLKLDSTPCLVVGGGTVAARKVKGLLTASAVVTVLAPKVCRELRFLTDSGRISWICRGFAQGDLEGYRLVITATDSAQVNRMVYEEATDRGMPVNSVDDPKHSSFFVPAVARRGTLAIAVSTSGTAPYLARRLREYLESKLYSGLEADLERIRAARARIAAEDAGAEGKRQCMERELEPLVKKILRRMDST